MIAIKCIRVERHMINKTNKIWNTIDTLCFKAKNLYNYANYLIRQEFINNGNWIQYRQLDNMINSHEPYKDLGSQAAQNTLTVLDKNWKSFFVAIKDWSKNPSKYLGKPKIPRYKEKNGRSVLMIKNIQCRLSEGFLIFSWKPLRAFRIKTNVTDKIMQVRFVPRESHYIMEIVFEADIPETLNSSNKIVGIDLGINNFATVSNNSGLKSFIINGKTIKSINQYYNKKKASLQSELMLRHKKLWSKRLQKITDKRFNKVEYFLHISSKYIVNWCVDNQIDTVVIGRNKEWKQDVNLGGRINQNFTTIPHFEFFKKLKYKCENVGIRFIETEESYTSGTSFLDNEMPIKENYDKTRRINRGIFKSNYGTLINADLNGSYQIVKKVFVEAFVDAIEGADLHPIRVNLIK